MFHFFFIKETRAFMNSNESDMWLRGLGIDKLLRSSLLE